MDPTLENYWRMFDVNLAWIRQSDTKAYTVFTIYGISISLVFSNVDVIATLVEKSQVVQFLALLYLTSSVIAIYFGFRCIQPSLKLKFPTSVIFFGSVSRTFSSPDEYFEKSRYIVRDPESMERELCNQIYINSIIAREKFDDINKSIKAFLVSLLTLIMIVLTYFIYA